MRTPILIGFFAALVLVFTLGAYMFYEPIRQDNARTELLASQITQGQVVFAQNCVVCHGSAGEGLGANPPLDNAGLRETDYDTLYKTISRGRYNTAMPAWGTDDGGPLNDSDIEAAIALIQHGDWQATQLVVADMGLMPRLPMSVTIPAETIQTIKALPDGEKLADGAQLYASNCVACHGANGTGTTLAPALNDATLRAQRTPEELNNTITLGKPSTLMAGWNQRLDAAQISNLVLLIQKWDTLPPDAIPAPPAQPLVVTPKMLEAGQALFTQNCSWCHGSEGQGTRRAPALNVQSFFEKVTSDAAMIQIVTNGVPNTAMPVWGGRLSASEIESIVAFVRQWLDTAPAVVTAQQTAGGPPWQRNNATTGLQPLPPSQTGHVTTMTTPAAGWDWRQIVLLVVPTVLAGIAIVWASLKLVRLRQT